MKKFVRGCVIVGGIVLMVLPIFGLSQQPTTITDCQPVEACVPSFPGERTEGKTCSLKGVLGTCNRSESECCIERPLTPQEQMQLLQGCAGCLGLSMP